MKSGSKLWHETRPNNSTWQDYPCQQGRLTFCYKQLTVVIKDLPHAILVAKGGWLGGKHKQSMSFN